MKLKILILFFLLTCALRCSEAQMQRMWLNKPNAGPVLNAAITSEVLGTSRNNFTGSVGFKFLCTNNCHIAAIGMWVEAGSTQSDCLAVNSTEEAFLTTSGLPVGFNYVSISPVALVSGNYYIITMQTVNGGDHWYDDNTTIVLNPLVGKMDSSSGAISAIGSCGLSTTLQSVGSVSYGPPNFLFTVP